MTTSRCLPSGVGPQRIDATRRKGVLGAVVGSCLHHLVHTWKPETLPKQALGSWPPHMTLMGELYYPLSEVAYVLTQVCLGDDNPVLPHDQPVQNAQLVPDLPVLLQCVG